MDKKKLKVAERALKQIAMREGKSVYEIKKEIQKGMLIGLCNQDPKVQVCWKRIPFEGNEPTPEEVIAFLAGLLKER